MLVESSDGTMSLLMSELSIDLKSRVNMRICYVLRDKGRTGGIFVFVVAISPFNSKQHEPYVMSRGNKAAER